MINNKYPISFYLQDIVKDGIDEMLKLTEIDSKEYYKCMDMPFDDYLESLLQLTENGRVVSNLLKHDLTLSVEQLNEYAEYIMSLSERLWLLNNSLIFVIDLDKALKLPAITAKEVKDINWDVITNSFITFSKNTKNGKVYLPSFIEYMDMDYKKVYKESKEALYRIRYSSQGDNDKDINEIYNISFAINKLPTVFVEDMSVLARGIHDLTCKNCNIKHFKTDYTFENRFGETEKRQVCHLSERRHSQCPIFQLESINAERALAIVAYISKMFEKRLSLNRKNSRNIAEYNQKGDIDLICSKVTTENADVSKKLDRNRYAEVSLLKFAKQENSKNEQYKVRCNITHRGHQSPREHYRRPHLRHYKSGKVVMVQGTTINKGKDKVIYRV